MTDETKCDRHVWTRGPMIVGGYVCTRQGCTEHAADLVPADQEHPAAGRALEFLNAVRNHPAVQDTHAQRWIRMACEALRPTSEVDA